MLLERDTLLSENFKAKMKDEEKASGIKCGLSEVEKALEEIAKKEVVAGTPRKTTRRKLTTRKQWK